MEQTIEIRRWDSKGIIFSYTCEDNTIGKTVEEAVKQGVSLASANLENSDLSNLNLSNANLSYSRLVKSNLSNSNLDNADLCASDLFKANLYNTNLSNTNLYYTCLDHSDLSTANLANVKGLNDQCPKEGSFIGWKKCYGNDKKMYIVKLEIPEDAKRSSATSNKCRCSKAKVLEIQNLDGTKADVDTVYSIITFFGTCEYKIGEIVEVPDFDEHYWKECAPGIHFFMNIKDAVNYY